jgi:hypothetical protein
MMKMNGNLKYGCIFFLLLLVFSCKTGKETTTIALSSLANEERIRYMLQSEMPYSDLSSSLKLTLRKGSAGKETPIDAQLRIVRGEAIQISLRIPILGSEAFRILLSPDEVRIIDRLNKQYIAAPTSLVLAQTSVDFDYYSLEALLTNRLFIAGKKEIRPDDYSDFRVREDSFRAYLSCSDRQAIRYDFESDYTHRIQAARMQQENGSSYLQCLYTDWGLASNNRTFPMTMDLQFHTPSEVFRLNFSCKSVAVDTGATVDYSIPSKYRPVSLEQITRWIESLL